MFMTVDIERVKKIELGDAEIGQPIVYCPDCAYQLPAGYVGSNKCANCTQNMMVITINNDLINLLKN